MRVCTVQRQKYSIEVEWLSRESKLARVGNKLSTSANQTPRRQARVGMTQEAAFTPDFGVAQALPPSKFEVWICCEWIRK